MSAERPILFSAPMVRALLDGSKTQTRRTVKPQPSIVHAAYEDGSIDTNLIFRKGDNRIYCPYGQPGDRLWVRESFDFLPTGGNDQPQACEIVYWATGSTEPREAPVDYNPMIYGHEKIRPSIHMPRWASRITLEIVSVRVERLHACNEVDAIAEGAPWAACGAPQEGSHKAGYAQLWEQINGPGSWDLNPWVWVIEFKRVTP